MEIELRPSGDGWDVVLHDNMLPEGSRRLGSVELIEPGQYRFTVGGTEEGDDGAHITLAAESIDKLREELQARLDILKTPSRDRLSYDTMTTLVVGAMTALASLASRTDSLPGFSRGLSRAIGDFLAEHVKEAGTEQFLELLVSQARARADRLRAAADDSDETEEQDDEAQQTRH